MDKSHNDSAESDFRNYKIMEYITPELIEGEKQPTLSDLPITIYKSKKFNTPLPAILSLHSGKYEVKVIGVMAIGVPGNCFSPSQALFLVERIDSYGQSEQQWHHVFSVRFDDPAIEKLAFGF